LIQSKYYTFNVMKSDKMEDIKKIKKVRLYQGAIVSKDQKSLNQEIAGGISIVYELKSGNELVDGLFSLPCTVNKSSPCSELELKENEYITAIYGTGVDFIKTLIIETNFYRKIKVGSKGKSELPSPKSGLKGDSNTSLFGGSQ
jgi:hypothetical protein